jgi:hypothetical protein
MARKFDSEITVTANDKWIFRGDEITQGDILSYFRKNIRQDENGVYIDNRFGELEEHGYINLEGYPLHIKSISEEGGNLYFLTDSEMSFGLNDLTISMDENGQVYAFEPDKDKILYRFSRSAGGELAERIQEREDGNFEIEFHGRTIPII